MIVFFGKWTQVCNRANLSYALFIYSSVQYWLTTIVCPSNPVHGNNCLGPGLMRIGKIIERISDEDVDWTDWICRKADAVALVEPFLFIFTAWYNNRTTILISEYNLNSCRVTVFFESVNKRNNFGTFLLRHRQPVHRLSYRRLCTHPDIFHIRHTYRGIIL